MWDRSKKGRLTWKASDIKGARPQSEKACKFSHRRRSNGRYRDLGGRPFMKTFIIGFFVIAIAVVALGFIIGNPTGTLTSVNASTDPVDSPPKKSLRPFRSEAELTGFLTQPK